MAIIYTGVLTRLLTHVPRIPSFCSEEAARADTAVAAILSPQDASPMKTKTARTGARRGWGWVGTGEGERIR